MSKIIHVLDHGHVRFIDAMGSDLSVVRNARVSHDAEWRTGKDADKDANLIRYLMKHDHNTPFEACVTTFEIKAPIFVARQWHRHRTQSYNEVSARYTALPEEFYLPTPSQIGTQSVTNHQSRVLDGTNSEALEKAINHMKICNESSFELYRILLDNGMPRELARSVLPLATYTRFFATANLHNWFRFIAERSDPGAQYEIQVYAEAIFSILQLIYPVCCAAFAEKMSYARSY